MDKSRLLRRLDDAWTDFCSSYAELDDSALIQPGVAGEWSVRDLIAHVTTWEEEALKYLPDVLSGTTPPRYSIAYGGIDAFNAQMMKLKAAMSLSELLRQAGEIHQRVVAMVEDVPEAEVRLETRFRKRLRLDTHSHYPLHTKSIREWREQKEKRDSL